MQLPSGRFGAPPLATYLRHVSLDARRACEDFLRQLASPKDFVHIGYNH